MHHTSQIVPAMAALACLFAACATVPAQPPADVAHVSGTGYRGIIVSAEFGERTYYKSRRLWTPTRKMVETFERRLAPRLAHERLPPADLWAQVRRRYLGMFEHGTGRKLMYVELLCTALYSEKYLGLPAFQFIPRDACRCESWYDPARKQILDFGCVRPVRDLTIPPHQPEPPATGEPRPPP